MVVVAPIEELRRSRLNDLGSHPAGPMYSAEDIQRPRTGAANADLAWGPAARPLGDATFLFAVTAAELVWIATLVYGIWRFL